MFQLKTIYENNETLSYVIIFGFGLFLLSLINSLIITGVYNNKLSILKYVLLNAVLYSVSTFIIIEVYAIVTYLGIVIGSNLYGNQLIDKQLFVNRLILSPLNVNNLILPITLFIGSFLDIYIKKFIIIRKNKKLYNIYSLVGTAFIGFGIWFALFVPLLYFARNGYNTNIFSILFMISSLGILAIICFVVYLYFKPIHCSKCNESIIQKNITYPICPKCNNLLINWGLLFYFDSE